MDVTMDISGKLSALQVMRDAPVIPVIVLTDVAQAVLLARALVAGGIRMLEVTLRTPQALACIEAIARDVTSAVTAIVITSSMSVMKRSMCRMRSMGLGCILTCSASCG